MNCPYCGADDVIDLGYDDGGGDYGDMITPIYRCQGCDSVFDGPGGVRMPPDDSAGQPGRATATITIDVGPLREVIEAVRDNLDRSGVDLPTDPAARKAAIVCLVSDAIELTGATLSQNTRSLIADAVDQLQSDQDGQSGADLPF